MVSNRLSPKLSVLYIGYPLLPVSDESCGGAEQMLAVLEAEIACRGHRTSVAGCEGSRARGATLMTGVETREPDRFEKRNREHCTRVLEEIRRGDFDLVHDKSGSFWQHAAEVDVPVLATLHLPRSFYPAAAFASAPRNLFFNCVSNTQAQTFNALPALLGVVRNGIAVGRLPFCPAKRDYLLWLGRVCEEKGTHLAIEAARITGLPLIIAGQVYPFSYHQQYYARAIRPWLARDNPMVCFLETPTFAMKRRLLSEAKALLVPSLVDETSSLVAMEAMACGTPVVAFRRGAIPEIVLDRQTGFIVDTLQEMAAAVWSCGDIDPQACRVHVESNYSASRMASEYEALYQSVLRQCGPGLTSRAA